MFSNTVLRFSRCVLPCRGTSLRSTPSFWGTSLRSTPSFRGRGFLTVVNQAEVVYREFLGSNRIRLDPGLRINLPILHQIKRIDLRENMADIPELHAYTKDNVPVSVTGTVFYKVFEANKAAYSISNYQEGTFAVAESSFRAVMGRFEFDYIIANRNELNTELIGVIGNTLTEWGVTCTRVEIQHVGPQNKLVAQQLEKQMEAERRRRENELDTQAKIRTAEGEKQHTVLKSEGELEAARNRTNAERYSLEQEATALAAQLRSIVDVVGDTTVAQQFLLETKRLEHLSEMAKRDNKVYFMNPQSAFPIPMPLFDQKQQESQQTQTQIQV